jgi:translation elongation factor EF-Tu-like GTPase
MDTRAGKAEDKPFLMPLEDVFSQCGRGTESNCRIKGGLSRLETKKR